MLVTKQMVSPDQSRTKKHDEKKNDRKPKKNVFPKQTEKTTQTCEDPYRKVLRPMKYRYITQSKGPPICGHIIGMNHE